MHPRKFWQQLKRLSALIFVFTSQNLHGGAIEIGWLFSGIGIGGIAGVCGSLPDRRKKLHSTERGRRAIAGLVALDGVVVIAFAGFHTLAPIVMLYTVFGFIGTSLNASMQASVATQSEPELRGRIFALLDAMNGPLIVISIAAGTPSQEDTALKDILSFWSVRNRIGSSCSTLCFSPSIVTTFHRYE